ncbi:thioesterase family protein [Aeromicrobium sp. CF3.5]|uniref:thioesterase family protein n=1 Tax=Aeromicrobium sp. CF3.5 TaxID=3373078 RepID=UPI003EE7AD48
MIELPTYDQVSELPLAHAGEVETSFIDENGHMNIGDYFRLTSHALWDDTRTAGISDSYIAERDLSMFTVEQHVRYLGEMRLGDRFTVHNRFIARSGKVVHAMAFLLDLEKQRLACTMEVSWVHVNMTTRSASDLPDDIAAGFDALVQQSTNLPWPAPVSGVMGVRS